MIERISFSNESSENGKSSKKSSKKVTFSDQEYKTEPVKRRRKKNSKGEFQDVFHEEFSKVKSQMMNNIKVNSQQRRLSTTLNSVLMNKNKTKSQKFSKMKTVNLNDF